METTRLKPERSARGNGRPLNGHSSSSLDGSAKPLSPFVLTSAGQLIKRFSDLILATLIVLCIHSWLIPLLAILIFLDSRGPVFFVQWRTGKNNRAFRCIKLRTMYLNKNSEQQAYRNDPRITPFGKFLRKFSLDELPQFFNVIAGHMSIVGPRPHMISHTSDFETRVRDYQQRLMVRPGITGLSQIEGYRGEIKETRGLANRVRLDIFYIHKWTLWLDVKIMFRTIKLILLGDKQAF